MAIRSTPRTLAQIGLAHQALGHWVAAERSLQEALVDDNDPWIARHRDVLERARTVIQSHLGWLFVESNAPGAILTVDGRLAGTLPLGHPIRVPAGSILMEVAAPGYVEAHRMASIIPGTQSREVVRLDSSSQPLEPRLPAEAPGDRPALRPSLEAPRDALTDTAKAIRIDHGSERPSTAGVFTLTGAALLGITAFGASHIRAHDVDVYNDSSRCVFGDLTREQRCGAYRSGADVALGVEMGAIAAASVATIVGEWLIATSMKRSRIRIERGAWTGPAAIGVFRF
jgi:hypothetical protein